MKIKNRVVETPPTILKEKFNVEMTGEELAIISHLCGRISGKIGYTRGHTDKIYEEITNFFRQEDKEYALQNVSCNVDEDSSKSCLRFRWENE